MNPRPRLQAKQNRRTDDAVGGLLNALGQFGPGAPDSVEDVVEVPRGSASALGHIGNGHSMEEEPVLEVHDLKYSSVSLTSQVFCHACATLPECQNLKMAWNRVDSFKKQVKEYQQRTGKTQAEVAKNLDTTYGTLRFWLSGVRPPKKENLQLAAALFGCSITEFIDDPGNPLPGIDPLAWASVSEQDRVLTAAFLAGLRDLPDEEKHIYAELLEHGLKIGRARMLAEEKAKADGESKEKKGLRD